MWRTNKSRERGGYCQPWSAGNSGKRPWIDRTEGRFLDRLETPPNRSKDLAQKIALADLELPGDFTEDVVEGADSQCLVTRDGDAVGDAFCDACEPDVAAGLSRR